MNTTGRRLTEVELTSGTTVKIALTPDEFDRGYNGALHEGRMTAKVPTVVGDEYIVIPQIVRWKAA